VFVLPALSEMKPRFASKAVMFLADAGQRQAISSRSCALKGPPTATGGLSLHGLRYALPRQAASLLIDARHFCNNIT
jgi:hypothetical protein